MPTANVPDSPVRLRALEIARSSPESVRYVHAFFSVFGGAINDLRATAAFRRLAGISQLGLKRGTRDVPAAMVPLCAGRESDSTELGPFVRTKHSERVCATMVAFCSLHDVPRVDALHAAVAALFHDLGHPAFSHTVEPVLARRGFPDHEETGRRIVREDPEIQATFKKHGIETERVIEIIREKGDLGLRQKLCDTLAYLGHDSRLAGFPIDDAFEWNVLGLIRSVTGGAFVVDNDDKTRLYRFLVRRMDMTADLYEHPLNRVNSLFVCQLVEWLVDNGRLEAETLPRLCDSHVIAALEEAVASDAPAWALSAWLFASHDPSESRSWEMHECDSESGAIEVTSQSTRDRPRFLLPPIDFSGKSLPIRTPSGMTEILRCSPNENQHHHKLWHVISYRGPV